MFWKFIKSACRICKGNNEEICQVGTHERNWQRKSFLGLWHGDRDTHTYHAYKAQETSARQSTGRNCRKVHLKTWPNHATMLSTNSSGVPSQHKRNMIACLAWIFEITGLNLLSSYLNWVSCDSGCFLVQWWHSEIPQVRLERDNFNLQNDTEYSVAAPSFVYHTECGVAARVGYASWYKGWGSLHWRWNPRDRDPSFRKICA